MPASPCPPRRCSQSCTIRSTREATARLAAASARAAVAHFVFVSSIRAQSGAAADHVLTERDPAAPTADYGPLEAAAEAEAARSRVAFTVLRPVPLYGPGVKGNFTLLLRGALALAAAVESPTAAGLGIDRFVSALAFVLGEPATGGETISSPIPGAAPRLSHMIAALRAAQHHRPLLLPLPTDFVEDSAAPGSIGLSEKQLGGECPVDPGELSCRRLSNRRTIRRRPCRTGSGGRRAQRQRLINSREHPLHQQLIETLAVAVE